MHKRASRSFFITMAVLALLALATFPIKGQVSPGLADDEAGLGKKIAGTYLGVQKDAAQILQVSGDGNLSVILSIQFSGGAAGLRFSNALGSWKKTGKREITARTVDLDFRPQDGSFAGVGAATYVINFDEKLQTASMTWKGAVFPPGVNPFLDPDADAIPAGEFTHDLELHRLPVDGDGDDDD